MDLARGDFPAERSLAPEDGELLEGGRSGPPSPMRTQPSSQAADSRKRPAPTPAEGDSRRPLRGVPAAAAALLGADGGSARRVPSAAHAAAASGVHAATPAGAAAGAARRGDGGTAAAAAAAAVAPADNRGAAATAALQDRDNDPWNRPAPLGAAARPAAAPAAAGRGEGAASRSQAGGSGFAAASGAAGGLDAADEAAAATPVRTRGTAVRREQDEDSWDRHEPLGAPGYHAAARTAAGRSGGGGANFPGGRHPVGHQRQGQGLAAVRRPAGSLGDAATRGSDGGVESAVQPPPRDSTWGEDYDFDSWDRAETWAPSGSASASAQARRPTHASGTAAQQTRGAAVAVLRAAHGGAMPSVRGRLDGRAACPAAGGWQDNGGQGRDRGATSGFPAELMLPRTPVQLRARADSRSVGRSEVEVAGYDDYEGEDNPLHDDEVMVVDEEPSLASYRDSRLNSARRGLDPASGRRLGFESQNIDPRAMAELVNSGGALAVLSRKRARVESGEYYSPVELRGLSREVVEAILGKGRTHLLTLVSEDDYWAARFKRAKEAKTVADAGVNAGFDPNHDPYKNLHRFSFTQTLEVCGSLDPKVLSKLLHSTTIFYQSVAADISASAAFQTLLSKAKTLMMELKADIARVRVAGGSLSSTVSESIQALMVSFFTLRASVMGELSKELPDNFAFRTQGLMVCWCFQKLSDDLKGFLRSLSEAISTEAEARQNAGESGDRFSAESWYTILSGFLAGMAGVRPFHPPTAETDTAAGRVSSVAPPAYFTVSVPTPTVGQGAFAPGFGGLAAPAMYSTVGQPMASMWTTQGPAAPLPPPPPSSAPPQLPPAPAYGYWTQSASVAGNGGRVDSHYVQRPVTAQAPLAFGGGYGAGHGPNPPSDGAPGGTFGRAYRVHIPSSPSMIGSLSPYREDRAIEGITCRSCERTGHYAFECPRALVSALGEPPPGWVADGSKDLAAWDQRGRELTPSSLEAYVRYIERHRLTPSAISPVPPDVFVSGAPPATAQRSRGGGFGRGRGRGR